MIVELNRLTIYELLKRSFKLYGNCLAVAAAGEHGLTYNQLEDRINSISSLLVQKGINPGDRIAILGENSVNWVIAYLATTMIGAVAVPILTGFPETDTRHIIRNSESVAIFIEDRQLSKIEEGFELPLNFIVGLEDFRVKERITPLKKKSLFNKALSRMHKGLSATEEFTVKRPEEHDLAAIIYTSGTTGHSKGVMLTHKNIIFDVVYSIERFPINQNDRFLSILPLAHTFEATGGMLCPLAVGASIFYLKGLPTPQKLLAAMNEVHPTAVLAVPLVIDKIYRKRVLPEIQNKIILNRLYKLPFLRKAVHKLAGRKLLQTFGGSLRFFMFGGAALNLDVEIFLKEAGIKYSTGYGMTETSPIMTINPFQKVKTGSCGKPIPGIEMKINDPDGHTGIGEILVRGPIVMQGYYKNPEATRRVFLPENWLKTGDLGYFDQEGYLYIKGRCKNVIVGPSGENIYPEIIEQLLLKSPYIQEVVVYENEGRLYARAYLDYDVLDRESERLQLNDAQSRQLVKNILEEIRQQTNKNLPYFSAISQILEHPEPFEKTPTNKVKRYLYINKEYKEGK